MEHKALKRYKFNIWANDRTLNHLKSLPDQVYNKGIDSVFSSIHEVVAHIYMVDGMWLSVMSGDTFEQTMDVIKSLAQKSEGKSLYEMTQLYAALSNDYLNFIQSLDHLDDSITINHPQYGEMVTEYSDLMEHVVNHGTYHRGNITAMLRQQGYPGIPTDYIFYLYDEK